MTGGGSWLLWAAPALFLVMIAGWIGMMLWGDRRRNARGDIQPNPSTGPEQPKRGPVQGGIIEGDPVQRRPGRPEPRDEDYYPGP
jgi:hypothetical protein